MRISFARTILAGLIATATMSFLMYVAPLAGFPSMNISELLASVMGGSAALGWASQFLFGVLLAVLYAALFIDRLAGSPAVRGIVFGLLSWTAEQVIIMPAIGIGFFSRSAALSIGSLFGHLVYGIVLATICGNAARLQFETAVLHPQEERNERKTTGRVQ